MKKLSLFILSLSILFIFNGCKKKTEPKTKTGEGIVYVRKNIYSYDPNSDFIKNFRKAVAAMQARPADDPTSWTYQAAIHGSYDTPPPNSIWNQCQHGSYYFLSWHRMYLYYFEKIVRKASGDPNFALPYWNYSDVAAEAVMPEAFRQPADNTNTLFVSERNASINAGAALPPSVVSYSVAFGFTNFLAPTGSGLGFGGQIIPAPEHFTGPPGRIEQQPHNIVHVTIGGWMSDPNTAAQDPIFWLHHANIDRLWEKWLAQGGGRSNPTDNEIWMNTPFVFYDIDSAKFDTIMGKDILRIVEQLDYKYDDMPDYEEKNITAFKNIPSLIDTNKVKTRILASKQKLEVKGFRNPIALSATPNFKSVAEKLSPLKSNELGSAQQRFILNLTGVTYDTLGDGLYEIYVNLPANVSEPDANSPYFVGTMGMFGFKEGQAHGGHNHHHDDLLPQGGVLEYDITEQISTLKAQNELKNVNVTIYFRPLVAPGQNASSTPPSTIIKIADVVVKEIQL